MDPRNVEKVEQKIEDAIAEVMVMWGLNEQPFLPDRRTLGLMAKPAYGGLQSSGEKPQRRHLYLRSVHPSTLARGHSRKASRLATTFSSRTVCSQPRMSLWY